MALEHIRTPAATGAVAMPQTASEWLLARYDREMRRAFGPAGDVRRIRRDRGSNFDRPIIDLLDDHPGAHCDHDSHGRCVHASGEASWPGAAIGDGLYPEVFVLFDETA